MAHTCDWGRMSRCWEYNRSTYKYPALPGTRMPGRCWEPESSQVGGPREQGVPPPQCGLNVQRQNQSVGPTGERPSQKKRARVFVMMPEPHSED